LIIPGCLLNVSISKTVDFFHWFMLLTRPVT
jgi:hypothetical protein